MNIASELHQSLSRYHNSIAISAEDETITYHSLYIDSLKIAAYLHGKQLKQQCIAVEIKNPIQHVTALLGVVFSGNFYISVTEHNKLFYASANLHTAFMLSDNTTTCSCSALLHNILQYDNVDFTAIKNLHINKVDALCAFFTSGSTGKPKVVVHTHQTILQDTVRQVQENNINKHDKLDLVFSFSFSASLACIFPALITGAELCIFDLKEKGLQQMAAFWQHKKITFSTLAVSSFRALCKASNSFHSLHHLRFISIGAEPVKDDTIELFQSNFPSHTILQIAYAATETRTIAETKIHNDGRNHYFPSSAGKAVKGKEINILDNNGKKVDAGTIGEIVVQSEYITNGYWNEPVESAFAFSKKDNLIIYKTGDIGYVNDDGYLFYCGRLNSEDKINGIKINLAYIDEAAEKTEGITKAVAVINTMHFDNPKLICFYTSNDVNVSEQSIRQRLTADLPSTHLPHLYIQVNEFPYTHTGKIDRKKLEQTDVRELLKQTLPASTANSTDTYINVLIDIFKKVLHADYITADSNFFNCGGDSLKGMLCIVAIEKQTGIALPAHEFLKNPVPARLSFVIANMQNQVPLLVKKIYLNGYSEQKRTLYFLNHSINKKHRILLRTSLNNHFNFIEVLYDLHCCYKLENGAKILMDQLTEALAEHTDAVLAGNSFNGFIAHQLSQKLPKLSCYIMFDTYNYFNRKKLRRNNGFFNKLKMLVWQTILNKDYTFPFYIARFKFFYLTKKNHRSGNAYLAELAESRKYLLANLPVLATDANCTYFQASRSRWTLENPGLQWKKYVKGNFRFYNFNCEHNKLVGKNHLQLAAYIQQIVLPENL